MKFNLSNLLRLNFILGLSKFIFCTSLLNDPSLKGNHKALIFIVLTQYESNHIKRAQILENNILHNAKILNLTITVEISPEDIDDVASWIYLPFAKRFSDQKKVASWYIFLEEFGAVDLEKLQGFLKDYDETQELYFGKSLQDRSPTIIHHFDSVDPQNAFLFPDPRTGIILSHPLMERLASKWNPSQHKMDFSIDASYEFSQVLSSFGVKLVDKEWICIEKEEHCSIWVESKFVEDEETRPVPLERIHFAVKTCQKFFQDRISILKTTWLPEVPNYDLYGDIEDGSLGVLSLNIPNTERGHCGKTMAIVRHAAKNKDIDWLVIADDDTLLSVQRLVLFLASYDYTKAIALGERYGYMIASGAGFNYLTGGAAMVLSHKAVSVLSSKGVCECPSDDTPDDLFLGSCLRRYRIPMIHSRRFHQARSEDYALALIKDSQPISFHKFWMIDPKESYKKWLEELLPSSFNGSSVGHSEL